MISPSVWPYQHNYKYTHVDDIFRIHNATDTVHPGRNNSRNSFDHTKMWSVSAIPNCYCSTSSHGLPIHTRATLMGPAQIPDQYCNCIMHDLRFSPSLSIHTCTMSCERPHHIQQEIPLIEVVHSGKFWWELNSVKWPPQGIGEVLLVQKIVCVCVWGVKVDMHCVPLCNFTLHKTSL